MNTKQVSAAAGVPSVGPGAELGNYALAELDRAIARLGWRGSRVHAGVHQARKSMRRLRATLRLGRSVFGGRGDAIHAQLQMANKMLSDLRDAQALVEALGRVAHALPDAADQRLLRRARARAMRRRRWCWQHLQVSPAPTQQAVAILVGLRAQILALPWAGISHEQIRVAFHHALRRAERAGRRAHETDKSRDWHRWRRQVRRALQQHRALLTTAFAPTTERLPGKVVEATLGEAQDCSLILAHCGDHMLFGKEQERLRALVKDERHRLRKTVARRTHEGSGT